MRFAMGSEAATSRYASRPFRSWASMVTLTDSTFGMTCVRTAAIRCITPCVSRSVSSKSATVTNAPSTFDPSAAGSRCGSTSVPDGGCGPAWVDDVLALDTTRALLTGDGSPPYLRPIDGGVPHAYQETGKRPRPIGRR